jgi:hypothetical protein
MMRNRAGLASIARRPYFWSMGVPVAKRLARVLVAVAFVLVTILPGSSAVMAGPSGAGMASAADQPCRDCPSEPPTGNDKAKMACAALACFGVVMALPTRQALNLPADMASDYPPAVLAELFGVTPAPDPFPPRSTVLI